MIVLILLVLLVGGLVEIVPLFFQKSTTEPIKGLKPYTPLQLAGRDIYVREGCYNCHSQMIRPFRAETLRYGHYSVAGEFVYDHPFQWGSKRTGPDLAPRRRQVQRRVASHPPEQPARPGAGVEHAGLSLARARTRSMRPSMPAHMKALRTVGVPYTDAQIAEASRGSQGQDRSRRHDRLSAGAGPGAQVSARS